MNHIYYQPLCSQIIRELLHAGADINATDKQVLICQYNAQRPLKLEPL